MEAKIFEEDELQSLSYMPEEGTGEICVMTSSPPKIEIDEIEVETSFAPLGVSVHPSTCTGEIVGLVDENQTYFCDKCHLGLSQRSTFEAHIEQIHVDEAYYACEFCSASAIHWSEYYLHQCTNADNKPIVCPHCSETVSTKKQLAIHEEVHALQRRFTTKKLDDYYARKLKEAEDPPIDWGSKPFICGVCGRPFPKLGELEYHEKLHSEERRPRNECSKCGMLYINKNDLNKHIAKSCSNVLSRKMIHKPTIR